MAEVTERDRQLAVDLLGFRANVDMRAAGAHLVAEFREAAVAEERPRLRAVIEAADAVLSALNACESNRGCFSTAGQHDYRCPYLPPSIAVVPESCECGRTLLDEALAHYRKVRDDGR